MSPPRVVGSTSECVYLHLRPETAWSSENLERMGIGGDADFEDGGSEGDAWITFQPNGTYEWSLNRFAVTMRGNAESSTPTVVTVHTHGRIHGTATPGSRTRSIDRHSGASGVPETRLTSYASVENGGVGSLGRIHFNPQPHRRREPLDLDVPVHRTRAGGHDRGRIQRGAPERDPHQGPLRPAPSARAAV